MPMASEIACHFSQDHARVRDVRNRFFHEQNKHERSKQSHKPRIAS